MGAYSHIPFAAALQVLRIWNLAHEAHLLKYALTSRVAGKPSHCFGYEEEL